MRFLIAKTRSSEVGDEGRDAGHSSSGSAMKLACRQVTSSLRLISGLETIELEDDPASIVVNQQAQLCSSEITKNSGPRYRSSHRCPTLRVMVQDKMRWALRLPFLDGSFYALRNNSGQILVGPVVAILVCMYQCYCSNSLGSRWRHSHGPEH